MVRKIQLFAIGPSSLNREIEIVSTLPVFKGAMEPSKITRSLEIYGWPMFQNLEIPAPNSIKNGGYPKIIYCLKIIDRQLLFSIPDKS